MAKRRKNRTGARREDSVRERREKGENVRGGGSGFTEEMEEGKK